MKSDYLPICTFSLNVSILQRGSWPWFHRGSQSTNDTEDQKLMDLLIIEQKVKSVLFCN